ncbi:MAG: gliding motility-associated C-terminal domain-containing protein [Flavobacteriales bacterium]|nr:gliding motility-associated C-terminal domain-containing protein [Flavobacteriales bacterium]
MRFVFVHIVIFFFSFASYWGQEKHAAIQFRENKGQYESFIRYYLSINEGEIYLEDNQITYHLFSRDLIADIHHHKKPKDTPINGHAYRVSFENANTSSLFYGEGQSSNYSNYFIGNNSKKWASQVYDYETVYYKNIYEGIDLKFYGFYGQVKYDFIVEPGANPENIILKYDGIDQMKIKNGHLFLESNYGTLVEQSPYAYQIIDGKEVKIDCQYVLKGNKVSFQLNEAYNPNIELIIDPVLSFATYTGSTASNFGCTATYDDDGNMYVGGTVFGFGYPTTIGGFQTTYNGGSIDMGITKFSSNGSNLIYSTYIGGSDNEIPHSLVVNSLNHLCIMGTSGSIDYPTTNGVYDDTFNAGPSLSLGTGYGFQYLNGCDIVISKLNLNGSTLLGSTFVGGTGNDGINRDSELHYNYGDAFRGEIIVDANDNIYVASTTSSTDFPTNSPTQASYGGGGLDGCVFKLNNTLSTLLWGTYVGGSNYDCAYSIQLDAIGDIFVTGGTKSTDFTTTSGALHESYIGGSADGFITHYTANGSAIAASTYIGTSGYDQCFFVQADIDDDIFVVGQTDGTYPITPGTYNNPNSGQFIQKLPNDLSSSLVSTTIGTGSGEVDIAISAFLVSDCNQIYISGWGGATNRFTTMGALATSSTTSGLPTTSPTFQNTTDGDDFYLAVLNENAQDLLYATFFGGTLSHEHVDGGTSRFDKRGKVYQAVCAGCGGFDDFPTNPSAWSTTNNSTNCNLGAFKFDLANITPTISIPLPYVCLPSSYTFSNNSSGGNSYYWDFGDGNSSTDFEPVHNYSDTGNYQVQLIVMDTSGCLAPDTAYLSIDVFMLNNAIITQTDTICPGDSAQLNASGGVSYQWSPNTYISNPTIANPYVYPPTTTTYQVVTTDSCGADTAQIIIEVYNEVITTMPDSTICIGNSVQLTASGGTDYNWLPTPDMVNPSTQTPTVTPTTTTTYFVDVTTANGCQLLDSVTINVITTIPIPDLPNDTLICYGDTINISASGGSSILWNPANIVGDPISYNTTAFPTDTTMLVADFINACGVVRDSFLIEVTDIFPTIVNDTIICPNDTAILWADNADFYEWSPASSLTHPDSNYTLAIPQGETVYQVICSNTAGCSKTLTTTVELFPTPYVYAGADLNVFYGVPTTLNGTTTMNTLYWESPDSLSCIHCLTPQFIPSSTSEHILFVEDENGCINSDTVTTYVNSTLYIPNSFSPNGDGHNDFFITLGEEITAFNIKVFDRWGLLIFESDDLDHYWDGKYKGKLVQQDAYIWKVKYSDHTNSGTEIIGHVNVIK